MTVHTSLEIRQSDLLPKKPPNTVRQRLWPVQKKQEVIVPPPVVKAKPVPRRKPVDQNQHVIDYIEWKGNVPRAWLKMRCREIDVGYYEIVGPGRTKQVTAPRHMLMVEMRERFPHMTTIAIARMFNRDNSVVHYAMEKLGTEWPKRVPIGYVADKVRAMHKKGIGVRAIGRELGYHHETVNKFLKRMGWKR